jgi:hypothetical protein
VEYDENICIIIKERLVIGCKLYKEIKHSIMNDFVFSRLCHNMGDLVLSAAACATRNGNKMYLIDQVDYHIWTAQTDEGL